MTEKRDHKPTGFNARRYFTDDEIAALKRAYTYCPETGKILNRSGRKVGYCRPDGYIEVKTAVGYISAHRLAWILYYGKNPTDTIDHINRCRSDNRICNLRVATMKEQCANSARRRKMRKTQYHGIKEVLGLGLYYTSLYHVGHDFTSIDAAVVFRLRHNLTI